MVQDQRTELATVKEDIQQIRDALTSHVAKEDVVYEIFKRVMNTGVTITGEVMAKLTLPAAAQTFHLQYRSNSGTLSYIRHARILALRLDAFDNHYLASSHASQNTSSASDTPFLTLTTTPLALSHTVIAVGGYQVASSNVSGYASVTRDGVPITEWVREAPNGTGWQFAGLAQRQTLAAVLTTWMWRARAEIAGTTADVGNLAIAVLQLEATPGPARRRSMAIAG